MERVLVQGNQNLIYVLKRSFRSSSIRIVISSSGLVEVTSPYLVSEEKINTFIISKFSWILQKIEYFKNNPRKIVKKYTEGEILQYKKQARGIAHARLEYFNTFYNLTYKKITIKNISSRWGSCSSKANLNFNYKIALLPGELSDYIIVHELCHLKEMNHSSDFWNLVERTIPNYKELRKQLKLIHL